MLKQRLAAGAAHMGIGLTDDMLDKFMRYHDMIRCANAQFNLTRVPDDPAESVDRNDLDSLAPLSVPGLMNGVHELCDLGSGAGFPGVPLAIALPQVHVVMMDSLSKRVAFLNDVIDALHLNARAIHTRAEDAGRNSAWRDHFDVVTARAVAALPTLVELTLPLLRPGGRMIAYKGPGLDDELAAAQPAIRALRGGDVRTYAIAIPGRDWDHRLCAVKKLASTPAMYPRKSGEASRNPIGGGGK